jgi:alkylated DNA repair dioxygenase AlkB
MSPEELEEYTRCKLDVHYFANKYCHIKPEDDTTKRLTMSNKLPADLEFVSRVIPKELGNSLLNHLRDYMPWTDTVTSIKDGSTRNLSRKMAYVTHNAVKYEYAGVWFPGVTFTDVENTYNKLELQSPIALLLQRAEQLTGEKFNSVLLNMYEDGSDEIRWHSDKEDTLGDNPYIACFNLGATRKFWYREIGPGKEKDYIDAEHCSFILMKRGFQKSHIHAILKEKEVKEVRISLTFRYNIHE